MHIPAHLMADWVLVLAAMVMLLCIGVALRRARWTALMQEPGRMHLVAGGAVACLLLWLLNIHLVDGMVLHFLGITTLTLVVGWSFTVLGASLAMLGLYGLQGLDWSA
ncbi:MAG: energy-coupling factor ABC transporter permease, partial [Congregibacter sp.]|nr:energy-coupling factor ABC transporter permease [Congregibacter sp.]